MPLLHIDFSGFWISGSGRGRGFAVDEEGITDEDGFPYLPGRHIKGVLRDATRKLLDVEADLTPALIDALFGVETRTSSDVGRAGLGLLSFRDARLSEPFKRGLQEAGGTAADLFRTIASTAMAETGVAATGTLRVVRVAVPLVLTAPIEFDAARASSFFDVPRLSQGWRDIVASSLVMVTAFGGGRNKGFGRCFAGLR